MRAGRAGPARPGRAARWRLARSPTSSVASANRRTEGKRVARVRGGSTNRVRYPAAVRRTVAARAARDPIAGGRPRAIAPSSSPRRFAGARGPGSGRTRLPAAGADGSTTPAAEASCPAPVALACALATEAAGAGAFGIPAPRLSAAPAPALIVPSNQSIRSSKLQQHPVALHEEQGKAHRWSLPTSRRRVRSEPSEVRFRSLSWSRASRQNVRPWSTTHRQVHQEN